MQDLQDLQNFLPRIAIALERIADSLEGLASPSNGEIKSIPPKIYADVESFASFDWEAIGAKPIERDQDGFVSVVSCKGNTYKRRNKQGDIWFSRNIGKDSEGKACYDILIRFDSDHTPPTELPRNLRSQFNEAVQQLKTPQQPSKPRQQETAQTARTNGEVNLPPQPQPQPKPQPTKPVQPPQPQIDVDPYATKQPDKPPLYPQHNAIVKQARAITGMEPERVIGILDDNFTGLRPDQMHTELINDLLRHIAILSFKKNFCTIDDCASSYDGRIALDAGNNYTVSHLAVFRNWCNEVRLLPEVVINRPVARPVYH